jgi:hypothetical protein
MTSRGEKHCQRERTEIRAGTGLTFDVPAVALQRDTGEGDTQDEMRREEGRGGEGRGGAGRGGCSGGDEVVGMTLNRERISSCVRWH